MNKTICHAWIMLIDFNDTTQKDEIDSHIIIVYLVQLNTCLVEKQLIFSTNYTCRNEEWTHYNAHIEPIW